MTERKLDDAEVRGANLTTYFAAQNLDNFQPILKKYGLDDLKDDEWYPMSRSIPCILEINENDDGMMDLISWGMKVGEFVAPPPGAVPLEAFIEGFNDVYKEGHRGADIGVLEGTNLAPGKARLKSSTPYPDTFEYGLLWALLRSQGAKKFMVKYDENEVRRDEGGDYTVYLLSWEL